MYAYIAVLEDSTILFQSGFDSAFAAECAESDLNEDYNVLFSKIVEV